MEIKPYRTSQFTQVKTLWETAFPSDPPWNRAEVAIPTKLAQQPELFLVAERHDSVIGTILAGYDGHRGWIYSLAVASAFQRQGVGTQLLKAAEAELRSMGCLKINLQVRAGNERVAAFYERNGYQVEDRVSLGRLLD